MDGDCFSFKMKNVLVWTWPQLQCFHQGVMVHHHRNRLPTSPAHHCHLSLPYGSVQVAAAPQRGCSFPGRTPPEPDTWADPEPLPAGAAGCHLALCEVERHQSIKETILGGLDGGMNEMFLRMQVNNTKKLSLALKIRLKADHII